jgi:hypothetical protein
MLKIYSSLFIFWWLRICILTTSFQYNSLNITNFSTSLMQKLIECHWAITWTSLKNVLKLQFRIHFAFGNCDCSLSTELSSFFGKYIRFYVSVVCYFVHFICVLQKLFIIELRDFFSISCGLFRIRMSNVERRRSNFYVAFLSE